MTWSNAGHPPPLLIPAHGDPFYLSGAEEDLPLCVDPGIPRTSHPRVLEAGDTLLLYTDGLVESPEVTLAEGQLRLAGEAARLRHTALPDLLNGLLKLSDHRDDTAMIAFRADPPE